MRIWSLPNRTHHFLRQTCVFNKGDDVPGEQTDGQTLTHVQWSSSGRLLAGALDNMLNIWLVAGQ